MGGRGEYSARESRSAAHVAGIKTTDGILDERPATRCALHKRISETFFKCYVDAMERLRSIVFVVALATN